MDFLTQYFKKGPRALVVSLTRDEFIGLLSVLASIKSSGRS